MTASARSSQSRTVALAVAVVAIAAALLASTYGSPGAGMDEGTLVAYPDLVLRGDVPGRDFETFYGPGGPYLMAGAFKALDSSVDVERAVGLAFRLAIVAALFLLLLPWGRVVAAGGGLISAGLMLPLGVSAVDWFGALAFALLGLALLAHLCRRVATSSIWPFALAGLLSAIALVFRPDLAPAVVLSNLPLLLLLERRERLSYAAGFAAGLLPLLAWLADVGPGKIGKLIDDLSASRPGRRLPLPSPITSAWGQVLFASILTTIGLLGVCAYMARRRLQDPRRRLLLSLGLFCLAILPSALERADDAHILGVGCVAVALIPALLVTAWPLARQMRSQSAWRVASTAALGLIALSGLVATVHGAGPTARTEVLGLGAGDQSFDVRNEGRGFPIESPGVAAGLDSLLPRVDAIAQPGQSVFVGPLDLRRTKYSDTYLYYLLPKLAPASFYTELNPGAANSRDSGLATELSRADLLLLTSYYDAAEEPNASSDPGAAAASSVVRRQFCEVAQAGSYRLYRRCRRPAQAG